MRRSRGQSQQFGLEGAEGELNLVPYLDIMVNLVMFMLFTFQVVLEMNVLTPVTPAYGGDPNDNPAEEKPKAVVSMVISKEGYSLLSSDEAVARVDIPKKGSEYDTEGLRAKAVEWKKSYDLGSTMILTAGRDIEYRTVVQAMDAIRKDGERDLFPDVLLGAVATPGGGQ